MSSIRRITENHFAGVSNIFWFLSFKSGVKLGGSNVARQEEVSSFLMNVRNVFRCKQCTAALGHLCPISLKEFLGIAESMQCRFNLALVLARRLRTHTYSSPTNGKQVPSAEN